MRLTIFWRVFLAQTLLIILVLAVSLYPLFQLNRLTDLGTDILANDYACIDEEERLLQIFFSQMRSAEKYLSLQDAIFYEYFTRAGQDFEASLDTIATLVDTPHEHMLIEQVRDWHARYAVSLVPGIADQSAWYTKRNELRDHIARGIRTLTRMRGDMIDHKTAAARDQAARAAAVMQWLTVGGIGATICLAYLLARGVSKPLRRLTAELRHVGRGEFHRSLQIRSPKEVGELAQAFNWMARQLAELDEMKADFVAHMSHELRTPLTAIQEGTALLLEEIPGPLSTNQREILEVVRGHGEQLFSHLSSVLDLSKMDAGMLEYVLVPSDMEPLIERSVATVQLMAQKKQIQIEVACSPGLPILSLDEHRIQQVLDNLLVNAVKFTPDGGKIRIEAEGSKAEDPTTPLVSVRVADTGIGVPVDEVDKIFDRFYQSQQHRKKSGKGTGLGLAIARHIIEAHGGTLWVENQPDQGSGAIFVFCLPVRGQHAAGKQTLLPALPPRHEGSHAIQT